jgi:hypothetical protein
MRGCSTRPPEVFAAAASPTRGPVPAAARVPAAQRVQRGGRLPRFGAPESSGNRRGGGPAGPGVRVSKGGTLPRRPARRLQLGRTAGRWPTGRTRRRRTGTWGTPRRAVGRGRKRAPPRRRGCGWTRATARQPRYWSGCGGPGRRDRGIVLGRPSRPQSDSNALHPGDCSGRGTSFSPPSPGWYRPPGGGVSHVRRPAHRRPPSPLRHARRLPGRLWLQRRLWRRLRRGLWRRRRVRLLLRPDLRAGLRRRG